MGRWNDLFASTTLPQITTLANLATVGTITSGTWNGTDIGVAYGGTGVSTFGGTNHILYTTAADTLASEAAFTYNATADRLTFVYASSTSFTAQNLTVGGGSGTTTLRIDSGTASGNDAVLLFGEDPTLGIRFVYDGGNNQIRIEDQSANDVFMVFNRDTNNVGIASTSPSANHNFAVSKGLIDYASSTALTVSGSTYLSGITSAIALTGSDGLVAEYTGTSCTNQFPRSLSALGVATCASVDLANDITGTLTIANGGTSATAFSPHTLIAYNGTSLVSTSTIAFQSFTATSTTATSTIAGGFTAGNNVAFSVNRGATANSLYVAENGSIGIGTAKPTGALNISDNSLATVNIDTYSNTLTNNSQVVFRKSRGTASAPLAIGSGYRLWEFYGQGHNGTSFAVTETARLMSVANGAINGARIPAYIRFDTSDGTNDMAERMRIDENGKLGIGTTSPTSLFSVHGNAYFSGDITNVSSITATGTLTVTPLTSALVLTGAGGSFAEYGGAAACTNQFVTALSVLGATTCASINNDQWSGTDLSVANGGTGASTLTGLLQGNGTGAITGITGTAGQFPYYNGTNTLLATSSIFLATSGNV